MSQSDSSTLSSPPSTDDEAVAKAVDKSVGLKKWFKPASKASTPKVPSSPPLPKRPASPPHEYTIDDNEDIAVRLGLSTERRPIDALFGALELKLRVANALRAGHRHVPLAIYTRLSWQTSSLRTAGYRKRR